LIVHALFLNVRKISNSKSDEDHSDQGHSRTLVLLPFDGPHMISYRHSIATILCLYLAPYLRYYQLFTKV